MRINTNESAILVIDYQERLIPAIYDGEKVVEKTVMLLEGAKILGLPIVTLRQYPKGLGDLVPEIKTAVEGNEPIDKLSFSACGEPAVMARLSGFNLKNIIVCGVEAHVCVLQTVVDLIASGFHPVLVCDCIGSRCQSDKEVAVSRMIHDGATITTAEATLFELLEKAGTPEFKAISKLVK